MNNKLNQDKEYMKMINKLIENLNKAKVSSSSMQPRPEVTPMFLFEFFIFELYLPRDLIKIVKQPVMACRLFDFPTLTFEGKVNLQKEVILFNTGKRSFFEMDIPKLKDNLINQPMYIMFLDLNHGNMKIIGNCRLNISVFAYDNFLNFDINSEGPDPRRNILQLFDNSMEKVGEFEISLLIRREYHKFDKNIEFENNKKASLIKKLKKNREKYKKENNEQLFFKGEEKPKMENAESMSNFYENNIQKEQTQPQYINNFILKGKDNAFNAHPVNKVIIIKPQSQSNNQSQSQPEDQNQNQKVKKKKKKKISKKSVETETDLLPGVKVPINNVIYNKGKSQNKSNRSNMDNGGAQNSYSNSMYNNKNNQQLIQSMYNKFQNNPSSNNNSNSFHYNKNNINSNSNNNFFNTNNSNFNNNMYSNRNNNNNKNIDENLLYYQTNGMNPNANKDNKNSNANNNSNYNNSDNIINYSNNLNETNKSNSNEYLKLVWELKSKINSYKDKLIIDQKNIQKLKEERNINKTLDIFDINNESENKSIQNEINDRKNIQEDNDSKEEPNQNANDNLNESNEFNKNDNNEFNNKDDNGQDINMDNIDNNDNNDEIESKKNDASEVKVDVNNNNDNIQENNNNKFNNIQLNSDYFEDNNSNNNINNSNKANKFNNIENKIINEDENIEKGYESDLVQNIDESQSNVLPNKGSSDNFVSSSLGQYFQKEEKKPGYNDKQNIIESTIKEEFNESNISDRKDININPPSEKSSHNKNQSQNQNIVDESEIPEESIVKRTDNANIVNQEYKAHQTVISGNKTSSNNESEIKEEPSLINKFNNYNYEINSGINEIQENIEEDSFNRNQKDKNNNASQSEIKEDTTLMQNYNMNNNGNHDIPNVKISNNRNSNSKSNQDKKSSSVIKSYNTDEIEEIIED